MRKKLSRISKFEKKLQSRWYVWWESFRASGVVVSLYGFDVFVNGFSHRIKYLSPALYDRFAAGYTCVCSAISTVIMREITRMFSSTQFLL